jgi:hypothetical protein
LSARTVHASSLSAAYEGCPIYDATTHGFLTRIEVNFQLLAAI